MVQLMDHVVYGGAALRSLVAGAEVEPHISRLHFRASLNRALAMEVDHEEVQLRNELARVLVEPEILGDAGRCFADLVHP